MITKLSAKNKELKEILSEFESNLKDSSNTSIDILDFKNINLLRNFVSNATNYLPKTKKYTYIINEESLSYCLMGR